MEWSKGRTHARQGPQTLAAWDKQQIHDTHEGFGWELGGLAAMRRGNWKADFIPYPAGTSA
jgi:arylsulfatase A-like enzyme